MTAPDTDTLVELLAECTPGPWVVGENDIHPHPYVCGPEVDTEHGKDRWVICYATGMNTKANAHLIALAPELAAETIALRAQAAKDKARIERLAAALRWYGEQARLARLIHSEGDAGRNALARDGGEYARAALEDGE